MAAITTEVVDTGETRDLRGRRTIPSERRAELLEAYRASGLNMAAFARREGIKYGTFTGWVLKAPKSGTLKGPIKFAEVRMPLSMTSAPSTGESLEVRLSDGTVLRGGRVVDLVALVRALRS